MVNLVIGLCFGVASAVAFVIMWRMTEQLRKEVQSRENQPVEIKVWGRDEVLKDQPGGS